MLRQKKIEPSYSRIAFVETCKDVNDVLASLEEKGLEHFQVGWVPTGIQADLSLRKRGISPITPTSMLSIDDRKKIYLDAVDWALHWLDENPINSIPVFFEREFLLTDLVKHNLYFWFDHLFYLVTLIEKTIVALNPEHVVLPSNAGFETVKNISITGEYFLTRVGKKVCEKYSIDVIVVENHESTDQTPPERVPVPSGSDLRHFILKLLSFWEYRFNVVSAQDLDESVRKKLATRTICSISGGGNREAESWRLKKLIGYLGKGKTADVVGLFNYTVASDSDKPGIYCKSHLEEVQQSTEFSRLREVIAPFIKDCIDSKMVSRCYYEGVDLNDLCNQKLQWILESYLPTYWLNYLTIRETMNRNAIDLALSASHAEDGTFLIAALHNFQKQNVPTLLCPHAIAYSLYDDNDKIQKGFNLHYKPLNFSHVASLGEFTKQRLRASGVDDNRVRVTGNLEYSPRRYPARITKWITRILIGYPFKKKPYCETSRGPSICIFLDKLEGTYDQITPSCTPSIVLRGQQHALKEVAFQQLTDQRESIVLPKNELGGARD